VPMDDLVLAGADDFRVAAERAGLSLVTEVEADLPMVSGEPYYLRRVLDNLVGNAIKFTPKGGTIILRLQRRDEWVQLQVCDTGIGIPPAEQKSIFARFYQVDGGARRKYGGMGLGLALVKEIVEAHGGTVDVESEVNKGSIFTVSLPIL
jgi:two-component system sensor histidine kinase BarA